MEQIIACLNPDRNDSIDSKKLMVWDIELVDWCFG